MPPPSPWVPIILQIAQLAVVAGAALGAYFQVRAHLKNRQVQVMLAVFEILENERARRARRSIYRLTQDPDTLSEEDFAKHIRRMRPALIAYSRVGYLLSGNYIEAEPILGYAWAAVCRCHPKVEGFLKRRRQQSGFGTYMSQFDELVKMSEQYRSKNGLPKP